MTLLPDPIWPAIVLAVICAGDAIICIKPLAFIAQCFEDVGLPRRWWRILPGIKFAAAAGLVAGIWLPGLGLVTSAWLVAYFVIAIAAHVRARDFGRNLFVNASGMLLACAAVLVFCFLV